MGLDVVSTPFLIEAKRAGVRFDEMLTLGRQYMIVGPERMVAMLKEGGCWPPAEGEAAFLETLKKSQWRFEIFARQLGAKKVTAMDASTYEQAELIHDLNQPISPEWENRFDVVMDGGTLEHVFNFPVAIANCMKMVKPGGHLILLTPANNYFGHGFYQFSPELFYRDLSEENGFEVVRMVGAEDGFGASNLLGVVPYDFPIHGAWHEVADPAKVKDRVTLLNHSPTALFVLAKKTAQKPLFAKTPQQSDYVPQWESGQSKTNAPGAPVGIGGKLIAWLRSTFSETFCREVIPKAAIIADPFRLTRFRHRSSFANRRFFTRSKGGS